MSFSNTFDTTSPGSAASNREDLTDVLTILAPEETPILSSAGKQLTSSLVVLDLVTTLKSSVGTTWYPICKKQLIP